MKMPVFRETGKKQRKKTNRVTSKQNKNLGIDCSLSTSIDLNVSSDTFVFDQKGAGTFDRYHSKNQNSSNYSNFLQEQKGQKPPLVSKKLTTASMIKNGIPYEVMKLNKNFPQADSSKNYQFKHPDTYKISDDVNYQKRYNNNVYDVKNYQTEKEKENFYKFGKKIGYGIPINILEDPYQNLNYQDMNYYTCLRQPLEIVNQKVYENLFKNETTNNDRVFLNNNQVSISENNSNRRQNLKPSFNENNIGNSNVVVELKNAHNKAVCNSFDSQRSEIKSSVSNQHNNPSKIENNFINNCQQIYDKQTNYVKKNILNQNDKLTNNKQNDFKDKEDKYTDYIKELSLSGSQAKNEKESKASERSNNSTNTLFNNQIDKILDNSEQEYFREILFELPHSFFILKNGYRKLKEKYESLTKVFKHISDMNVSLGKQVESKSVEIADLNKKIHSLKSENSILHSKQLILEQYEKENKEYRDLIHADREFKNKEMDNIVKECISLRLEKSKILHENISVQTEKEEYIKKFNILLLNNSIIKEDLNGLRRYVDTVFQSFLNCTIFKEIPKICDELDANKKLKAVFKSFCCQTKLLFSDILYLFGRFNEYINTKDKIEDMYKELIISLKQSIDVLKDEHQIEISHIYNKLLDFYKNCNISTISIKLEDIVNKTALIVDKSGTDTGKKQLLEIIMQQKREIETQKLFYEQKIKDLLSRIDEQEDVWDVFK